MSGDISVLPAEAGWHGFDTAEKLKPKTARLLSEAGFHFAVRYLSRKEDPPAGDLTADEADLILDAGLALMAVQHVAKAGWAPSAALGERYGRNAVSHARAVGLPDGTSIWLDLEEVDGQASAQDVIAYCNAWFHQVEAAGYTTGVYVGANAGLSADQLYWLLKTQRYWKSGSNVPDIPTRGYCMIQHIAPGDSVAGVSICRDVVRSDAFGNVPMLATRGVVQPGLATAATTLAMASAPSPVAARWDEQDATLRSMAADFDLAEPMEALIAYRAAHGEPAAARYWAIADFNLHSATPRLFIFDSRTRSVKSYLCAHGQGSEGPTDDGRASVFSNKPGSNATSLGIYRCSETYSGKHGYSMRLDGLESTNSNARDRAVVVHGAIYVSPEFALQHGRIGRSDGCLAVENRCVTEVVNALTGGSLVIAWYRKT